ncbi:MAG TPA: ABC transporter permease [Bryobacteraceae bacterium]|nr:ABC transporter permease [Bryobacteraceae bacterium]
MKRLGALWHRRRLDRDLQDELAFHLAMSEGQTGDPGVACRRLGNVTALKETTRDLWSFAFLESCWHDFRSAMRTLRANPQLTAVAALALGLGLGANTTVFTVVSSALSFDMGVDHVERMVALHPGPGAADLDPAAPSPLDFLDLRKQVRTLGDLAAYRYTAVNVSDGHAPAERLWRVEMTASGWAMVRQKPLLGREFSPRDEAPGATPEVLLSHKLWDSRYGRDASIVGRAIRIDDVEREVIGVMPPGAQFPEDCDLWTPLTVEELTDPAFRNQLTIFGRLAGSTTLAAAQSEVEALAQRRFGAKTNGPLARVRPFLEMIGVYNMRPVLMAMVFAVGFVLLIVCADVANLLLARSAARAREISIRIAIGAGRARIVRQLLIESVLLAAVGGVAGWMVAILGLRWFENMVAQGHVPSWVHFAMNARGFAYLAAISIGAGILFGLAPALDLSKVDVNSAIKDGGHGAAGAARGRRFAGLLVGFQMALCVILLAGAGLMIHSTLNLYNAPMAINPQNILTMRLALPETKYASEESVRAFYRRLKTDLGALPGVSQVALTSNLPLSGWMSFRGELDGAAATKSAELDALVVDRDYFHALGVGLRKGEGFSGGPRPEAIVNRSLAEKFWPGEDPLGKRLRIARRAGRGPWLEVVGVAPELPQDLMRPLERQPLIYLPFDSQPEPSIYVMARTAVPPATLVEAFRHAVENLDRNLPAQNVSALEDRISSSRLNVSSFGRLFSLFAAIALVLASVGLYAVVAHTVSRRTQEIGIRMALGGTRKDIFGLVLKQGMRQVAGGLAAGIPVALVVTRALSRGLVGVSPTDPATYAGVAVVLALAGFLGCALPARRAIRIDPLAALRHE